MILHQYCPYEVIHIKAIWQGKTLTLIRTFQWTTQDIPRHSQEFLRHNLSQLSVKKLLDGCGNGFDRLSWREGGSRGGSMYDSGTEQIASVRVEVSGRFETVGSAHGV